MFWDEFVRLFRAKFVPEHIQDRMEQEFLSLTQGSMTVLEYEARFAELSKYASILSPIVIYCSSWNIRMESMVMPAVSVRRMRRPRVMG